MKFLCIAPMALVFFSCNRKTVSTVSNNLPAPQSFTDTWGNSMLLGIHTKEDLEQLPYSNWFIKNYNSYRIDSTVTLSLKPLLKNKQFEIFMGTWCGDSQREVPGMFKLLELAGVQPSQIKLIMVDNHDSTYKQSPGHEEQGKNIHRVPDLIVYEHHHEINRIIESPVISLENDVLNIVKQNNYHPNYQGAEYLVKLTRKKNATDILADSTQALPVLKGILKKSSELNTLGYVWMAAGETDKALLAFRINAMLFPLDANVYDSLGEWSIKMGDKDAAKKYNARVLEIQPANTNAKKMMEKL